MLEVDIWKDAYNTLKAGSDQVILEQQETMHKLYLKLEQAKVLLNKARGAHTSQSDFDSAYEITKFLQDLEIL